MRQMRLASQLCGYTFSMEPSSTRVYGELELPSSFVSFMTGDMDKKAAQEAV